MNADQQPEVASDTRPLVRKEKGRTGLVMFAVVLAIGAGGLFGALNARRVEISSPATTAPPSNTGGMIVSPPPLSIPDAPDRSEAWTAFALPEQRPSGPTIPFGVQSAAGVAPRRSQIVPVEVPMQPSMRFPTADVPLQPTRPGFVYQAQGGLRPQEAPSALPSKDGASRASRLSAPSMTVTQGTVIQAVLESALDSNHPGFARAIVSRDVSSFDGTRVLIPKGSRLFGEYKADVSRGQNRALIQWHRLTRPDGTIIDVDSPSADPLGRAGVKGKVNTHFFERFGGAILQSVLDAGVQVAAREASGGTVILALPNSTQVAPVVNPDQVRPTIKVRQGTSVSVLVVRDLDFSDVEQ